MVEQGSTQYNYGSSLGVPVCENPFLKTRRRPIQKTRQRLLPKKDVQSSFNVNFPFPTDDLQEIFGSADGILRTETGHLNLTEDQMRDIAKITNKDPDLDSFDRFLIFVDGSSDPAHRHHHMTFVNEYGNSDAWAFAVLGEQYTDEGPSQLTFLGWTSQTVCYECEATNYTGVEHIGPDVAEREALLWAGLWRLSIDNDTPTTFCFDSVAAGYFANGHFGAMQPTPQHRLLRGIFQALEAMLGYEFLGMHHVHGHRGLIWNELVDAAARYNSQNVCYNHRQRLDIRKWKSVLHHLWIPFSSDALPRLHGEGLSVPPPNLPSTNRATPQCFPMAKNVTPEGAGEIWASFATANVRTLSTGQQGFRGKVDYLQAQFASYGLNIVGLQETRTDQKLVKASKQPYLRYCGGHDNGHHGVELWLSTTQPIGYLNGQPVLIQPQNVVILHKDPRRILARIETTLEPFFVAVLHGPQSGITEEVRKEWWEDTVRICADCVTDKLVLLCDANAASGPRDDIVVFEFDDDTTPNTPHFIDALLRLNLCLPSTGQTHQGPHCTWISPDARTSRRIDYVCISQSITNGVGLSAVLSDIDLGNGECDHTAVGLQITWPCTTATTTTCRARPKLDDSMIRTIPHTVVRDYLQNDMHWTTRAIEPIST